MKEERNKERGRGEEGERGRYRERERERERGRERERKERESVCERDTECMVKLKVWNRLGVGRMKATLSSFYSWLNSSLLNVIKRKGMVGALFLAQRFPASFL